MSTAYATQAAQGPSTSAYAHAVNNHRNTLLQPGQVINVNSHVVTVERYLSQGGFAHVYVVQSQSPINNMRQHVLKRMAVPDENMLLEVRNEVDAMKVLRGHPNIVNLIDASSHPLGNGAFEVFILMEFCPGGGIIDMMNRRLRERLTEAEILQIFVDVCEGVAFMHNLKPALLHRDLKVENILQATATSFKLCDFGSAAPASSRGPSSTAEMRALEADLNRHTTLQYRAPEMVDLVQRRPIDEKSDVWALGVLLYKLCYYTTPFEEHGPLAIVNVSYRTPTYPVYSAQMNALIASMLREHGTQRPTVFELLDEVHRMRGTKSPFRYSRPPVSSSSLRATPAVSQDITSIIQPKTNFASGSVPQKQVIEIPAMRRGRPSQSVTLMPASVPLSPVKSGPSRVAEPQHAPIYHAEITNFSPPPNRGNDANAWSIPGLSTLRPKSRSPAAQESSGGFADSFNAPPASTSSSQAVTRPPPLPNRTRPSPPARQHHRTGPTPKRDAFEGLSTYMSKTPFSQAPTLGSLATANLDVGGAPVGLRSPSAPYLTPATEVKTGGPYRHQHDQTTQRPTSSAPSAELSAEERFPSIEDIDRRSPSHAFRSPSPPRTSSLPAKPRSLVPPAVNGQLSSMSSRISASSGGSYTSAPSATLSQISKPPSPRPPSPHGPRPRSPQTAAPQLPSRPSGSTRAPESRISSNQATGQSILPQTQKSLLRRPSVVSKSLKPPSSNGISSGIENGTSGTAIRPVARRTPSVTSVSTHGRDWLTGDDPASPAGPTPRTARRISRPSSPQRQDETTSVSSSSTQSRIPRKTVPSSFNSPSRSNRASLRPPSQQKSSYSAESSGGEEDPEDAIASAALRINALLKSGQRPQTSPTRSSAKREVGSEKAHAQHARKSSVYDLVDVGGGPISVVEKQSTGLKRSPAKRRSVQDLVDLSSPTKSSGPSATRHARRQTSVQDLIDVGPASPAPTAVKRPMDTVPDSQGDRSPVKTPYVPSSPALSPSLAPPSSRSQVSRPRPQSLFLPPSNNFLSPPSAETVSPGSDETSTSPRRPTAQRRLSISDMVSKYEALRVPEAVPPGTPTRTPSGTYSYLRGAGGKSAGLASPSAPPSKPPTTQPRASQYLQRSPVTPSFSPINVESTGLGGSRGHLRTISRVVDAPTGTGPPGRITPVPSGSMNHIASPNRLNIVPPADFPGGGDGSSLSGRDGRSSPTRPPSPERPYQGVGKLISQWQKKTEEANAEPFRKPAGGRPLLK